MPNVIVDTTKTKGKLFKVKESSGTFYVYYKDNCIGKAKNMDNAIVLVKAKASEDGEVRKVSIE